MGPGEANYFRDYKRLGPIASKYSVNPSSGMTRHSVRAILDRRVCAYRTDTLLIYPVRCLWSTPLDWLCGRHGEGSVGIRRCRPLRVPLALGG